MAYKYYVLICGGTACDSNDGLRLTEALKKEIELAGLGEGDLGSDVCRRGHRLRRLLVGFERLLSSHLALAVGGLHLDEIAASTSTQKRHRVCACRMRDRSSRSQCLRQDAPDASPMWS